MGEKQFNEAIDELTGSTVNRLPSFSRQVQRSIEQARLSVQDVVAKHSNTAGIVPRPKQSAVVRELASIENTLYHDLRDSLQQVFLAVALSVTAILSSTTFEAIASKAIVEVLGLSAALIATPPLLFISLLGISDNEYSDKLARTPFQRKEQDGLKLNDRLRKMSGLIMRDISSTLRQSIRKSEVSSSIERKLKKEFDAFDSRVRTIVETEALYVMRNSIATFAEQSGIAKGLRIQDYEHGAPGEHQRHTCYQYAHRDDHGLGIGVYSVGTRKVRNPHPRCRSTLHLVFKEGL